MNRTWQVRRDTLAHADGQRRWDRAYQLLLCWAAEVLDGQPLPVTQEDDDAHRVVCSGFDESPTADPHD